MKKILVPLFLCIAGIFNISPIYAQENTSLENTTSAVIEPRADILQWILKTENGKCINVYGMHLKIVGKPTGF